MIKAFVLSLFCVMIFTFLFGHEGHHTGIEKQDTVQENIVLEKVHSTQENHTTIKQFGGRPQTWMEWIGGFHFIFLHFPLALIAMTAVSELLYAWYLLPIFDYSSRFMLISASILAVPTALFGLIYSYTATYSGLLADFLWWHMWVGIITAVFAIIVTILRERYGATKSYYTCLIFLFLLINITGYLGGGLTFGPYIIYPPL
jgi:uncharacterized membrane protein